MKFSEHISIRCTRLSDGELTFGYDLNVINYVTLSRICDRIINLIEEERRMGTVVVAKKGRKLNET